MGKLIKSSKHKSAKIVKSRWQVLCNTGPCI